MLTLSFEKQGYSNTTALDQMTGQYIIYNEKLNGRITRLKQEKENGQTIMIVDGADKLLTDVCETYMRNKHGLDADTVMKAAPYVWGDRNTPYKNFLHKQIFKEI